MRWILIPAIGGAFAVGAVWAVAGILAANTSLASASARLSPSAPAQRFVVSGERSAVRFAAIDVGAGPLAVRGHETAEGSAPKSEETVEAAVQAGKSDRPRPDGTRARLQSEANERFERVVKAAALSPQKLAAIFEDAGLRAAKKADRPAVRIAAPTPERFAPKGQRTISNITLAYADPSGEMRTGALAALSTMAPTMNDAVPDDFGIEDEMVILPDAGEMAPDAEGMPSDIPLPLPRPRFEQAAKPAPQAGKPEAEADEPRAPRLPRRAEPKPGKPVQLAFARPDNPDRDKAGGGLGNTLKGLFNPGRPSAGGGGVAVYDISAARVYMPDGSVLEAHSGIGKMADNPRYVHVKMNGPTPPHVYNLKMREKRFHGVEAIRMLPVDGKNKHGRDGFLTHSYLLRGGRPESHGCVAFKNYDRFLTAFKKGKVKQLVVVPGGGRAAGIRMASNARGA